MNSPVILIGLCLGEGGLGLVPWVGIAVYFWSPTADIPPPAFVYGINFSMFILFNSFVINMVLQYKQVGPWRSYFFGEPVYIVLGLVAKSALVWQVFSGILVAPQGSFSNHGVRGC